MRKTFWSSLVGLTIVLSMSGFVVHALAQEATPTPIAATGVSAKQMGSAETIAAPGHTMYQQELTFEPGAIIPRHTHSGSVLVWVESGSLSFTVFDGELVVTRAPVDGEAGVVETFGAGEEVILEPGDSSMEQGGQYEVANENDGQTVTRVSTLGVTGAPFLDFVQPEE